MFNERGVALQSWQKQLAQSKQAMALHAFIERACSSHPSPRVFVDCTPSNEVVSYYNTLLGAGVSIITPNKKGLTGKWKNYKRLQQLASETGARFLYDTTVGAGLPVISTLQKLLASGDQILKIEGVLSGTLSYIFNHFAGERRFSDVVYEAKEKGFTETDPREDLFGNDFARKLLILGREMGLPLELSDIEVENLVPFECQDKGSINDFFIALRHQDKQFEKKRETAEQKGCVLRYIGTIEKGKTHVSLQNVNPSHPFYHLSGSDNIVSFTTANYHTHPLVIKGAGAGADVTAAGVLADIVRAITSL